MICSSVYRDRLHWPGPLWCGLYLLPAEHVIFHTGQGGATKAVVTPQQTELPIASRLLTRRKRLRGAEAQTDRRSGGDGRTVSRVHGGGRRRAKPGLGPAARGRISRDKAGPLHISVSRAGADAAILPVPLPLFPK